MDYGLESEVWKTAQRIMLADCFRDVVVDAVTTYRRLPGHSVLERMHVVAIGVKGIEALRLSNAARGGRPAADTDVQAGCEPSPTHE